MEADDGDLIFGDSQPPADPLAKYRSTYNKSKQSGAESQGLAHEDLADDDDADMAEEEDYVKAAMEKQQKEEAAAAAARQATRAAEQLQLSEQASEPSIVLTPARNNTVNNSRPVRQALSPAADQDEDGMRQRTSDTVDRDDAFLQVVTKAKKGANQIDEFDKDFNNLKITKTKKATQAAQNATMPSGPAAPINYEALVADFDTDTTGNFIRIEKRDLIRKDKGAAQQRVPNPDWAGRPNFKKFKKVGLRILESLGVNTA
jgi:hypothetical protein